MDGLSFNSAVRMQSAFLHDATPALIKGPLHAHSGMAAVTIAPQADGVNGERALMIASMNGTGETESCADCCCIPQLVL